MSTNNEIDDELTVHQVFSTLKSPTFLKNLFYDILSDFNRKSTYSQIRILAEKFVDQSMEELDELSSDSEEDMTRMRAIINEVCMMSYTIDRVFSKVMYMRLEIVYKSIIVGIINDLRREGRIPDDVWNNFKMRTENPKPETSAENTIVKTNPAQDKKEVQKVPIRVGKRKRKPKSFYTVETKKTNSKKEILDDLKKVNIKYTNEDHGSIDNKNTVQKKQGETVKELSNKSVINQGASTSSVPLTKENVTLFLNSAAGTSGTYKTKIVLKQEDPDFSDTDSEISVGGVSNVSDVSSVHTSDLSSYEDDIILSSEDEYGEKKKISVKEVQRRFAANSPMDSSATKKPDIKAATSSELKNTTENAVKNTSQTVLPQSPSENGLSKRPRKPNSKYSSMYCPAVKVKERKKFPPIRTYGKASSEEPQNKKQKVEDNVHVDVATITMSTKEEANNNGIMSPAKQPKTPEMFKTNSANRSLTSRRTAPVTLFST